MVGLDADPSKRQTSPPPKQKHSFFRVRLINIDHVLTYPSGLDRTECAFNAEGQPLRKVPVLRIFGATPAGQRVCLHVHNVFPYCYVRYKASLEPAHVLRYIHRLGRELNAAMAVSLRRNPDDPESNQFIAAIHLCKGVDFYGYHLGYTYFLKISFIDPSHSYRLAAILESGGVMKTVFQPYEIHIRYQLQFMLDYSIFGCDYLDLDDARFRLPVPEGDDVASDEHGTPLGPEAKLWNRNTIPTAKLQGQEIHRASHCQIEIDANAHWIVNRRKLRARELHHDFDENASAAAAGADQDEKLVPSLRGLWDDERMRRLAAGLPPSIPVGGDAAEVQRRQYQTGESPKWMSEERMRMLLAKRLADEKAKTVERERRADHFTKRPPLDDYIMTTFDAVEVFHPYSDDDPTTTAAAAVADPYTQRSGPASSCRLYDLDYSMTQGGTLRPSAVREGNQADVDEDDDESEVDLKFFKSQEFRSRLDQVETAKSAQEHDVDTDLEEDEADQAPPDEVDGEAPGTPVLGSKPLHRTGSNRSSQSLFTNSPTPSPKKVKLRAENGDDGLMQPRVGTSTAVGASGPSGEGSDLSRQIKTWSEAASRSAAATTRSGTNPSPAGKTPRVRFASNSTATPPNGQAEVPRPPEILTQQHPASLASTASTASTGTTAPLFASVAASAVSRPARAADRRASSSRCYTFREPAPPRLAVTQSFGHFDMVRELHQDPFFSRPEDVPEHAREYAGRLFRFQSNTLSFLRHFQHWDSESPGEATGPTPNRRRWQFGPPPPTRLEVDAWRYNEALAVREKSRRRRRRLLSQIEGTTQPNEFGFKVSQHAPTSLVARDKQHMTILAVEVHCCTRGGLFPDPAQDAVEAIAYSFQNEDEELQDTGSRSDLRTGLLINVEGGSGLIHVERLGLSNLAIETVDSELDLFNALVDLVRAFDPEILVGWEIHSASWGYLVERAMRAFDYDLVPELGRVLYQNTGRAGGKSDNYAWTQSSALRITGRHVLNLWRLMKGELALNVYSRENVCYHLLHRRIPKFSYEQLTEWYRSGRAEGIVRTLRYYVDAAELVLEIIQESEYVLRTAEFARIYGIDFFSVISRGSQFKVESIMLRIAKPESFVLISPNRSQVGKQNAAEALPLIMEPQSAFYKGPLMVLDFQSLYPSIMIAHNFCYSTCLGRVSAFRGTSKFGVTELELPKGLLSLLKDDVNISSNGLLFVKPHVRRSLLAKMLSEILDTRVMVKGSMKGTKGDRAFQRIQNARQLSLKLLANVTYGYTSASYSGRMPCVEIADAIVQTGRETLEKAMDLINGSERWNAQVVYGDTDSLFVYLPGRTKDDAFRIGYEIADAVTLMNPAPVKLKFEKVYLPSVLLAKKRYVGFKYETPDETEPGFDAKGIETVRRDGHPALQRILEASIRILFRSRDLSAVKAFCQRQFRKIIEGRVSIQDFIFAKEVRLGSYSDKVAPPPGAAVASRKMLADPRSEPQHAERVPYIISQGEPKARLNAQAVSPEVMLRNPQMQINAQYYITRTIIPPLARVFNLLGADVEAWYHELPKTVNTRWHRRPIAPPVAVGSDARKGAGADGAASDGEGKVDGEADDAVVGGKTRSAGASSAAAALPTLNVHYRTETCYVCTARTENQVCLDCQQDPLSSIHRTQSALHFNEVRLRAIEHICATCAGLAPSARGDVPCISLDCPILYSKVKSQRDTDDSRAVAEYVAALLDGEETRRGEVRLAWRSNADGA
ncbi:uncharacterized protein PFL1_05060 [Pseudozyma flocculosa PF-1]|uniref:DNA polymerase n=2 Tax=Pseudozyma flocculosa TaxID=84751 RepID=A0A5C3EUP4_9BASI|nr:uncharacterized protein PFL1_05060 [Pseudozyma flocculosa PF-1]EPQ27522.1 hypothetical protein PFL1_05060 [Pseudozyma flocculosa PF-1]SPO36044.1 probable catalytic subunit of DNA polymerase zeta UPR-1 [Pseudozyma flocculosa]